MIKRDEISYSNSWYHWWHTGQHIHSSPSLHFPWHIPHHFHWFQHGHRRFHSRPHITANGKDPHHLQFWKNWCKYRHFDYIFLQLMYFQCLISLSSYTYILRLDNTFVFTTIHRLNWRNKLCHSLRKFKWKMYHQLTGFDFSKNDIHYRPPYSIHEAFTG